MEHPGLEIILWIVIVLLFIGSFVGIVFPIIPSVLFIWLGFIVFQFGIDSRELNTLFWLAMILLTILLISSDIIANSYFVKRFGGSKAGEWAAAVAVIIGSFITPPFGIIYVPFLVVFIVEMLMKRTMKEAFRASIGSLLGFLGGTFAKITLQFVMIAWFFILIIF
ncbi:DUF456 domain-containing protein [Oceanobacillus alkalisoli]|uniref:DUF456 domain-containing protein n=1 Tax=Oceanobacillus alkalisoli TaxID=2925113 RepID=UPI001F11D3B6|nr:DUF456 domain-containing protein [Oceanobacillus alkalisoli]MCF3944605.1 DUF456 domain-containing protein [Oceanobacillus alkalisoli]